MKRHGAAVIVIAAVAILNLGSGSRADDRRPPSAESCKTELGFVFDWCESRAHWPCGLVADEDRAACQAGCVLYLCPEQITCTELDPMWCAPCEDSSGATFWRNSNISADHCDHLMGDQDGNGEWDSPEFRAWRNCRDAVMTERCPAYPAWREQQIQKAFDDLLQEEADSAK
ncbi:hypothetical protein [Polyangium mundeleinium]|uniref:Uncharacterized protein n=1 Tax=Polyangium mundeleinium TaxID=2995306 RepID=A0ABT5EES2_9BACT|nr:hypothetical protein [Polyangium mundeleinium]MDC0739844.1 hypothetical protein [Polyangium mundeleinium]